MFYDDDNDSLSDIKNQMEDDFAYDLMMDTNFSGAFPENGEADYPDNDDCFLFSDDDDEDF